MQDFVEKWLSRAASVKGVVFDFGGVISVSPREGWALYPFCAKLGIDRAALDLGWTHYRHLWDGGVISFKEMYSRIFADAGVEINDTILEQLWEIDAVGWIRELRPETLELMRALKTRGFKIGILTNMSGDFHEKLFVPRAAEYRALADAEVVSGLVKMYKPERPIYDLMASRLGLSGAELLFLDDTLSNVEAARTYGWQAEVYD